MAARGLALLAARAARQGRPAHTHPALTAACGKGGAGSAEATSYARAIASTASASGSSSSSSSGDSTDAHSSHAAGGARVAAWRLLAGAAAAGLAAGGVALAGWPLQSRCEALGKEKTYTAEEVARHRTKAERIWVTYRGGVYDVTDWADLHPGGAARVMLAAGGPLEPFWSVYQQHAAPEVHKILEGYRVGALEGAPRALGTMADPYSAEPARHPALIVRTPRPYNAETPAELLGAALTTPNELFYIRNHLPVPEVHPETYMLRVEGEGVRTLDLSLADLRRLFRRHTVTATLQCSGNRRHQMSEVKPVKGLDWAQGAIGTAEWGGCRLVDVLQYAGLDLDDPPREVEHVQFEGLDADESGGVYGASVPAARALDRAADVLLAYDMNGKPLPQDHGFPLRVVVPGVTGARSVKWLAKVVPSRVESGSHWQQKDYKAFSPSVDWDSVDWGSAPAIQETPVQSAITEPETGAEVDADEVTVKGYAYSGAGMAIIRVDVSADGGKTWHTASLRAPPQQSGRAWAWTLWEATVPLPPSSAGKRVELMCKATDAAYNTQPESAAGIWNLRGVLNNAWHRVQVAAAAA